MSGHLEQDEQGPGAEQTGAPVRQDPGQDPSYDAGQEVGPTGNQTVDEVLRTMQGLQDRPVEEHVAVFEAAHEKLRAALAEASDRPSGPPAR